MRTSRISQDTSRALRSAAPSAAGTTTRATRTTRSALARTDAAAASPPLDIEDAIPAAARPKRKRPLAPPPALKPEIDSASDSALSPAPSSSGAASPPPKRRARQPTKQRAKPTDDDPISAPPDWETVYSLVKKMRTTGAARDAAVDTMGCDRLAAPDASPRDQRFQTLVALMLSSQTRDTTTAAAMRGLQTSLPGHSAGAAAGLTLENVLAVPAERLNELIWSVGFHNNKTKYIKAAAELLRDEYGGDVPDSAEALMRLPGVGPKMAYLCVAAAWGKVEGIGVDVHVHRITNLWGWQGRKGTKGPEETRRALQAWLPKDRWKEINWLLVGLGQTVCAPERGRRRCGECEVGLAGLCAGADGGKVGVGRRAKAEGLKVEYEMKGEEMKVVKGEEMNIVKEEKTGEGEMKVVKKEKTEEEEMKAVKIEEMNDSL